MSYNILDTLSVCSGLGAMASYYKSQDERETHGKSHSKAVLWDRITMATATVFAFIASSATISKLAWLCGYNLSVKGAMILGGAALSIAAISAYCVARYVLEVLFLLPSAIINRIG